MRWRPLPCRKEGRLFPLILPAMVLVLTTKAQQPTTAPQSLVLSGQVQGTHDPSIAEEHGRYYVFATGAAHPATASGLQAHPPASTSSSTVVGDGAGVARTRSQDLPQLPIRCSDDLHHWTRCGEVFASIPSWIQHLSPKTEELWAPDISYFDGLYHLYYAFSLFGKNTSGIALATNATLDRASPRYEWVDRGLVLRSQAQDDFNAIDPNLAMDDTGGVWLSFGSFWSGIKMRKLDRGTGLLSTEDSTLYPLASRAARSGPRSADLPPDSEAVEAPFVFHHGGYFYLFVSWDLCCRGAKSSYKTMTGRARQITGPYLDKDGRPMQGGGGSPVLLGNSLWAGPGGESLLHLENKKQVHMRGEDLIVFHAYDANNGRPSLHISTLGWKNDWPEARLEGDGPPSAAILQPGLKTGQTASVVATSTTLTASHGSRPQGLLLSIHAAVAAAGAPAVPTGTVRFREGATVLATAPLDITGRATFNTVRLSPGTHTITAAYEGSGRSQGSTATGIPVTITQASGATYTNPLPLSDPALGAVTSCPDPAIIKSQTKSMNSQAGMIRSQAANGHTWYLYCTGDAHNAGDLIRGTLNASHRISIFSSSDLIHWTYLHDALSRLPRWAAAGAHVWAPAIKFFNGEYYLYYTITRTTYAGGTSAIGVGTSATPAGPFLDSGAAVVQPETVPTGMRAAGSYRWIFDPDEVQDSSGQRYLLFGSYQGGISVRKLSPDGLTTDASSEVLIAKDQRYEGGAWVVNGGYYFLLASSTNCCAGPLTGYGVFAGRATSPLGPYLDAQGQSMSGASVGGTPVLAMNGNSLVGPGGGSTFTDEAGHTYYAYHTVLLTEPYFKGFHGSPQRPAAYDALDFVNGWPLVRGGFGPSDTQSPQPAPAAQPGMANAYTTMLNVNDEGNTAIADLGDGFTEPTLRPQWTSIHSMPAYQLTGRGVSMPTLGFDTTTSMASLPILAEAAPAGDYMVETKLTLNVPITGSGFDFTQAGLVLYGTDANYLRVDLVANSDTRQIEFIKSEVHKSKTRPTWGATDLGPSIAVQGVQTAWLRIARRRVDGADWYTGYSSVDGTTWLRCGTWKVALGPTPRIGLYGGSRTGYTATFQYIHVSTLE